MPLLHVSEGDRLRFEPNKPVLTPETGVPLTLEYFTERKEHSKWRFVSISDGEKLESTFECEPGEIIVGEENEARIIIGGTKEKPIIGKFMHESVATQ